MSLSYGTDTGCLSETLPARGINGEALIRAGGDLGG